jgi:aubergine-like protein
VIFEDLSKGYKEFHLASVSVREGTCTPVSFKVGFENKDSPIEAIAEITYNQTYCYYNWTGSVRVPATLQYANKLAKLYSEIGDELKTDPKNQTSIRNRAFFL